ncbi:hypothetical protein FDT66_08600 [Polaribacter aestuariivivens]|uniref:Tetratricopeptide repeat protein n=1 Tax=Polaribacter aestuariivivens TaxID=2304626 RepID=A0A5S3N3I2_9FLAO|nr:hypothetical protein [Polaribacter aestuariivivens]TMM29918.1 hypothetical protein FDT66_08600 [Polaribacter aestuariivivens]
MILKNKNTHNRKNRTTYLKLVLFSLFFILFSVQIYSQDSIPAAKDLSEEKELLFQQSFFKALSEKSIGNYQKAIENLENCNQILPNNLTVFFEFSKNYLSLNNTLLAKEYINRALEKEPTNIWMLKHLVKIQVRARNFNEAIKTQQKVIAINKKEREYLVRLFLQNRDYKSASSLLNTLESEDLLSENLRELKFTLDKRKVIPKPKKLEANLDDLLSSFETDKSYKILEEILNKSKGNTEQLYKYSLKGITLFPAQPFVYLINGKSLNEKKEFKKAIETLQNGIDFVIEDAMEADFYKEMAVSYKGLGNTKDAQKFLEKYKKLKGI